MPRYVVGLFLCCALAWMPAGCASSQRQALRAASGAWNYTVFDTPAGDVDGELRLSLAGGELGGQATSEVTDTPVVLYDVLMTDQNLSFSADFVVDGEMYRTRTTAALEGSSMSGDMNIAGLGTYRFQAARAQP